MTFAEGASQTHGVEMDKQGSFDTSFTTALRKHLDGDLMAAEMLYRQIIHADPDMAQARNYLGFLLQQTGRFQEAIEQLASAIALDGGHAEWHFNLGVAHLKQEQAAPAIAAFNRAIGIDPDKYFYWTNLGAAFELDQEWERAEHCYKTAVNIDPDCPDAYFLLAALYLKLERFDEARQCNYRGIVASPAGEHSKIVLGQACHESGRTDEAIALMERWLADEPDNPEAKHLLAAYRGRQIPEHCSNQYVERTFDAFASSFENVLGRLKYCGPQLVQEYLAALDLPDASLSVLDLGCGTGMVGEKLKCYAHNLVGVDLSQAMIARAEAKQLYQQLHKSGIVEYLQTAEEKYDLISCMDTLIYLGRLDEFFDLICQRLNTGGRFIFSTEKLGGAGNDAYHLNISGRYSHHPDYVARVLDDAGLQIQTARDVAIRTEAGIPIAGQFVCAVRAG